MVVLTETLATTAGVMPTWAGVAIHWTGEVAPGAEVHVAYALSPTLATPLGTPLTNTAEIGGSVLGPFTRQAVTTQARLVWLPVVVMRGW